MAQEHYDKKSRREKGTGTVYQRDGGIWAGENVVGRNPNGTQKVKCFSGQSEADVERKVCEYNKSCGHIDGGDALDFAIRMFKEWDDGDQTETLRAFVKALEKAEAGK